MNFFGGQFYGGGYFNASSSGTFFGGQFYGGGYFNASSSGTFFGGPFFSGGFFGVTPVTAATQVFVQIRSFLERRGFC